MNTEIYELLRKEHEGDIEQLEAIFSDSKKIVVEAPAGCGKTKTLVSKVANSISSPKIQKNKKILALTFSVNAAFKIKKDIYSKLPELGFESIKAPGDLNHFITITNYHGFARRVLANYGYLISPQLININSIKAFNESVNFQQECGIILNDDEKNTIINFSKSVNEANLNEMNCLETKYYNIIVNKLLPNNCITYNAYILLCKQLFIEYPKLKLFYQKLYPFIIIDEFQDTNILSWTLVKQLVNASSELFFMGDSLQRIYGFIGAVPDLMNIAQADFSMKKIILQNNYRFRENKNMLLLDRNIRKNAENHFNPSVGEEAEIDVKLLKNQVEESIWVCSKLSELIENHPDDKVAILVQQRGVNIDIILKQLDIEKIDYFYALFSDQDTEYINFHDKVLKELYDSISINKELRLTKRFLNGVLSKIKKEYVNSQKPIIQSLLSLTEIFFSKVSSEYSFLANDEKFNLICDTFINRALKQNMEYVQSKVIISTVHGAKGLEWERVIMPDMEAYLFPNYHGLCGSCDFKTGRRTAGDYCRIVVENHDSKQFIEALSILYVGVTRARKEIFFSASKERINNNGEIKNSYISCLLTLPGIKIL